MILLRIAAGIVFAAVCLSATRAQTQTTPDFSSVLQNAVTLRQHYVETFKDLTAVETKTTEIFNKQGKVEKRREVVSDFLVYESPIRRGVVSEYRIAREVDGKPVGEGGKQAIALFEKLAKAKTLEQEGNRLRDQNLKYTLGYYRWGVTLQPAIQLQNPTFTLEIAGRDKLGDRETIIVGYRRPDFRTGEFKGLVRGFKNPKTGNRGRVWLDAETSMIWRWENESTIVDREISTESVLSRDVIEYEPSAFGVNLPKRIVTSFFDKAKGDNGPYLRLAGRITYTYEGFSRFQVSTDYRIETP